MTRPPASVVRARTHGAAEDIAALAGHGRLSDRPVRHDLGRRGSLALSLRAGESG